MQFYNIRGNFPANILGRTFTWTWVFGVQIGPYFFGFIKDEVK